MARIIRSPRAFGFFGEKELPPPQHPPTMTDLSPIPICVRTLEEAQKNMGNKIAIAPDISLETACEIVKLKWMQPFSLIYVAHPEVVYTYKDTHPWANVTEELKLCLLSAKKEILIDVLKKRGGEAFPEDSLKNLLKNEVLMTEDVVSALEEYAKENKKIGLGNK